MPELGGSITEGTVLAWCKQVGDLVAGDEVVCEIATDKVDTEITSPAAGRLEAILVGEGETAEVGTALALLVAVDADEQEGASASDERAPAPDSANAGEDAASAAPAAAPPPPAAEGDGAAPADALPRGYERIPHEIVATTHVRRAIATHMTRSLATAAHATVEVAVDLHRVAAMRDELNAAREAAGEQRLSFLPFVAYAACAGLRDHPWVNATFEPDRQIRWKDVNLGVAVDAPQGLLVPVVRQADKLTVGELGDRIRALAAGARSRSLSPDDLSGGTFAISNLGSLGAIRSTAVINQPQVAILGVGATVRTPVVVTDAEGGETISIRPLLQLAITYDHRALDGADATRYVTHVKSLLETSSPEDLQA